MYEYEVRRDGGTCVAIFASLQAAVSSAQHRADENNCMMGVYKILETFTPKPEMVSHDIDKVIERMKKDGGDVQGVLCSLLLHEKDKGMSTIRLPANVDLN